MLADFPSPAGIDGYQSISGVCSAVDQIYLPLGNHIHLVTLVNVPTMGLPLDFFLTYNSQESVLGPVGAKWRHNWMAKIELSGSPVNLITFTDTTGRRYDFVQSGGNWVLSQSMFMDVTLVNTSGQIWRLTFFPDGDYMEFDAAAGGRLVTQADRNGNQTTLEYNGSGQLWKIKEPTNREIVLEYTSGKLTKVIDPKGNQHTLGYDNSDNLTSVTGPEGCVLSFGYSVPSDHLITSRTDANNKTYTYTFHTGTGRLWTVSDPETPANVLTYSYGTESEWIADPGYGGSYAETEDFETTTLVDARNQTWKFRFDDAGNLWRSIDPLGHQRRFYWDNHQQLLYETEGYTWSFEPFPGVFRDGPKDNLNNRFRRRERDAKGNLLLYADANGVITTYEYDANSRLTAQTEGHISFGYQGNWHTNYGKDGYVLCAFENSSDVLQLPSSNCLPTSALPAFRTGTVQEASCSVGMTIPTSGSTGWTLAPSWAGFPAVLPGTITSAASGCGGTAVPTPSLRSAFP